MAGPFAGFDWDEWNRGKCVTHGVTVEEIEGLFAGALMVRPDIEHSQTESRFQAVGRTASQRMVFLVFTVRDIGGERFIRPISARFMHDKEVEHYEKANT
jgi:uncharacterized DUF497 family protein